MPSMFHFDKGRLISEFGIQITANNINKNIITITCECFTNLLKGDIVRDDVLIVFMSVTEAGKVYLVLSTCRG